MIEVKNVNVTIGKNEILQDISAVFETGKILRLIALRGILLLGEEPYSAMSRLTEQHRRLFQSQRLL